MEHLKLQETVVSSTFEVCRPLRVSVEGNIASGKSTFLAYCAQCIDIEVIPEPVDEWQNLSGTNLLAKFYTNPNQWAVSFQSYVTLTMLEHHVHESVRPIRMTERSLLSSRNCFIEGMFEDGLLEVGMVSVFDRWHEFLNRTYRMRPHVIVYIYTTPSIAHQRLILRARPEEATVPLVKLEQLHRLHANWIEREHAALIDGDSDTIVFYLDGDLPPTELREKYDECLALIRLMLL